MPQHQSDSDLDRTDELPRLDVAAYEASLRERGEDPLARTDTWVIKALQDSDGPDEAEEDEAPTRHLRPVAEPTIRVRPIEPTRDVTSEVDSVLRRIDQLEKELDAARTESQRWQARSSELTTERAEQEARATALTTNNARLVEQQQIAYDRTQVLEVRMREEGELATKRLTELQNTLQADRATHAEFKHTIEQKLTAATGQIETLTRARSDLLSKLSSQTELAETRGREVVALQASLANQHRAASDMARLLAGKLTEYDALLAELDRREAAMTALEGVRVDLTQQLDSMTQAERQRSDELAQSQARLAQSHKSEQDLQRSLSERQQDIAQRDAQIQQFRIDIARTTEERDTARTAHTAEQNQHAQVQTQLAALKQERENLSHTLESTNAQLAARTASLEEAQRSLEDRAASIRHHEQDAAANAAASQALRTELEGALAQVVQLATLRDQLTTERNELATRLDATTGSLTELQSQSAAEQAAAEAVREELARVQALADERNDSLTQMQESFEELRTSSQAMEQTLGQVNSNLQRLQTKTQEQMRELEAQQLELAASRAEVSRHARAQEDLERAVRLRDELLHTLRQELQTAQDERGIMASQLDKARSRTKTLAERIFKKDARIASLRAELAVHSEALAALHRDGKPLADTDAERVLEPLDQEGEPVVLNRKVMTVGRTDDNDVCVPSKMVSRRHARLLVGPNAVIVEDAGSTNGCYVNNQQVRKHLLRDGDVLLIGDRKFKLRSREKLTATVN